jgi:hypothetical protein
MPNHCHSSWEDTQLAQYMPMLLQRPLKLLRSAKIRYLNVWLCWRNSSPRISICLSTEANGMISWLFCYKYILRNVVGYVQSGIVTYLRSWALPEKLPIVQPLRKFPSNFQEPQGSSPVSPPLVPILSQFDPIHNIPSYLSKTHFIIVHPLMSWSS